MRVEGGREGGRRRGKKPTVLLNVGLLAEMGGVAVV